MDMHVIKEPTKFSFNKVGIKGKLFPISQITEKISFVLIKTSQGHQTTIIEHKSDFIYYIVEGNGHFVINKLIEPCTQGDLIVIPAGTPFTYKGIFKMLLSCTPPWTEDQEEEI